jgi:hypothetical protein
VERAIKLIEDWNNMRNNASEVRSNDKSIQLLFDGRTGDKEI